MITGKELINSAIRIYCGSRTNLEGKVRKITPKSKRIVLSLDSNCFAESEQFITPERIKVLDRELNFTVRNRINYGQNSSNFHKLSDMKVEMGNFDNWDNNFDDPMVSLATLKPLEDLSLDPIDPFDDYQPLNPTKGLNVQIIMAIAASIQIILLISLSLAFWILSIFRRGFLCLKGWQNWN